MSASDNIFHPDFVVQPYWWDANPPTEERNPLPSKVDIVIVGSGYCGLAAGLELARSGLKVCVLDSGRIGEGASTRNGGMVSGGLKVPEAMRSKLGAQRFNLVQRDSVASFTHFEEFLKRENFDISYQRCGRFTGAHSRGAYRRQERQAADLVNKMGLTVTMVPESRQHEEIGSDFYHGGMVVNESGGIDPARYHRLLREAYQAAGGTLHGFAKVENIAPTAGGFTVTTSRGTIAATQVFVATNGYSGSAMPYLQRRIIPITSFVITTEELPPELILKLNPNKRMLVDTKRILYWYRLTPDNRRIIFGGRASFRDVNERESAGSLYQFMCGIWPQLQGIKLTHAWKGNVAFTFDHLPHMGVHEGVHYAGGCQGAGVAMATYLGHQTALKIIDPQSPRCGFDGLPFSSNPLYYGKPWFLPIVGNYYKALDRLEQRTGW
ncbi:FAD-binding oxidoreductase [Pusillimonas sp. ANT_WB101]|uniref:NAD(P)/FAD-dependent oxidoreductase n=1 Tax=Pusillimonas sp. ANT_WB101 TaxID=2597356 RepID=UPI0011EF776B|nr:FAD-binding oxidoreductase [Pusillimonas sp. ANT_WB101]KAA0911273.1 FAD-binding oxidoreductase [Pusillimonas sp. ANT_WB101]